MDSGKTLSELQLGKEKETLESLLFQIWPKVRGVFGVVLEPPIWKFKDHLLESVPTAHGYHPQKGSFIAINPKTYCQIPITTLIWGLKEESAHFCHSALNPGLFRESYELFLSDRTLDEQEIRIRNRRLLEITNLKEGIARLGGLLSGMPLPPDYGHGQELLEETIEGTPIWTIAPPREEMDEETERFYDQGLFVASTSAGRYIGIDIADKIYVPHSRNYSLLRKSARVNSFSKWADVLEEDLPEGSQIPETVRMIAKKRFENLPK